MDEHFLIRELRLADSVLFDSLLDLFGEAFEEEDVYGSARPRANYVERLLSCDFFIALAAFRNGEVVGGLAAYELIKFEQERSEIYVYDLAVAKEHRRNGVATALIEFTKEIARDRGAHVIFIQADCGDDPAISLYSRLGKGEEVVHFDIAPFKRANDA